MAMKYLDITGVGIEFDTNGSKYRALQNVNLKLDQGEFVSLIGHSGCGKSTVLNIVAGLHRATEGGVVLEGKEVTEPGPDRAPQGHAPAAGGRRPEAPGRAATRRRGPGDDA